MTGPEVHHYTDPANVNHDLCGACSARRQGLTKHKGIATACSECALKYFGVWRRWKPLIESRSATDPLPPLTDLQRFVTEARLDFKHVGPSGDPDIYVGHHGTRKIAFPCVRPELMNGSSRYLRWRDTLQACKWFMPAFITGGELEMGWYDLWDCPESERQTKFDQLMHGLYTSRRQARSILHYYNLREFTAFRPAIVDAIKAAHLGLFHASTSTLVIVVEGILKEIRSSLGFPATPPHAPVNVPVLVTEVFDGTCSRIFSYRGYGQSSGYNWIPKEYTTLEIMARQDHYFMFLALFKDFLLRQLYANTLSLDVTDRRVLSRHAIAHGIAPSRGIALDTIKLIGVLDGLASIIGRVTDQQFGLYGVFHGAHESGGGMCHEPGSSIEAVDMVFAAFQAVSVSPAWVALVRRASEIMDGVARNGTVIPFPPPPTAPPPPPTPLTPASPTLPSEAEADGSTSER